MNGHEPDSSQFANKGGTHAKSMQWPGGQSGSSIAAHRPGRARPASAAKTRSAYNPPTLPLHKVPTPSNTPIRPSSDLLLTPTHDPKAVPGPQIVPTKSPKPSPRPSARRLKHAWVAEPSLVNILSQSNPERPWSRGGYTGHTELETALSEGQLLPGTVSWYSPRNHIGVHPESLLYNRDPEQLAEDVIGLASRNANLLQENRLAKVQINKLSTSLEHERADADQMSEALGISSPRRPYTPTTSSRPTSPRQRSSPRRPSSAVPLSSRPGTAAAMPDWMLSDLQQHLNSAQQMLTQQSMLHSQHRMTWPRPASPSSARKGARPLHSHISLHPDSRLADAFAIYGVPRGITRYMSKKWGQSSPREKAGNSARLDPSSMDMAAVLREKVEAVSKASHVILLEAVQLRAHFPPVCSPEESAKMQPHLDALIEILHNHCVQVQTELGMLPEEPLRKLVASHHHMHQALDQATATPPPQQSQDLVVDSHEEAVASPAAPSSAVSSQQDDDLQLVTDAAADLVAVEAPDHVSESGSEQEHDLAMSAAEESVLAEAEEDGSEQLDISQHAQLTPGLVSTDAADEVSQQEEAEEARQQAEEEDQSQVSASQLAQQEAGPAQTQPRKRELSADDAEAVTGLRAADPSSSIPDDSGNRIEQTLAPQPSSGMMDEYLRRMHWSRSSSLPTSSTVLTGENGRLHANVPSAEVPVDVVTYDDSAADHVAPVSAEAAQVAFEQAGRSSFVRREDAEHPGMHVAGLGAAAPLHIESPWQAEAAQAGATQQGVADSAELLDAEAPADSEPKEAAELVTDELEGPDAADTNATELVDKTQQALAGDSDTASEEYEEVFEDADSDSGFKSQPDSPSTAAVPNKGLDQFVSNTTNPLFGGRVLQADTAIPAVAHASPVSEGSHQPDAADDSQQDLAPVSLSIPQGPLEQPFTPTASPSLFSPKEDVTDDVDAFSKTLNSDPVQPARPDQAMPTSQGLARVRSGSRAASEADANLTPSYRHQVRSMGQATDNEHPFTSTIPRQQSPGVVSQPNADGNESLTPPLSRHSSMGTRKLSRPPSAGVSRQTSMTKPASLAPSSRQTSFGGNTDTQTASLSRLPSNTALASDNVPMVISNHSSRHASRQPSMVDSAVVSRQASSMDASNQSSPSSTAASPVVSRRPSRQASMVDSAVVSRQASSMVASSQSSPSSAAASPVISRRPSRQASSVGSAVLAKQPSSAALAVQSLAASPGISRQPSRRSSHAGGLSSTASAAVVSRQPSTAASLSLSKQTSSVAPQPVSRQLSYISTAAPSHAASHAMHAAPDEPALLSKQSSTAHLTALSREGSYAAAGSVSNQPSFASSADLTLLSSDAVTDGVRRYNSSALSKQGSGVPTGPLSREGSYAVTGPLSREGSYAMTGPLSREGTYAVTGPLSKQPGYIPVPSPSRPSSRRTSLGARLLKETSQVLAPEDSEAPLSDSVLAGDVSPGAKAWRETSQPEYIEVNEDWQAASKPASRQQSMTHSSIPACQGRAASRQPSMVNSGTPEPLPRHTSFKANNGEASQDRAVSRQPFASTKTPPSIPRAASMSKTGNSSTSASKTVSRQQSMTDAVTIPVPSKGSPMQRSVTDNASNPISRQASTDSIGASSVKAVSRQPSISSTARPLSTSVSRQASMTGATATPHLMSQQPSAALPAAAITAESPLTAVPSQQAFIATAGNTSEPVFRQPSLPAANTSSLGSPSKPISRQTSASAYISSHVISKAVAPKTSITPAAHNAAVSTPVDSPSEKSSAGGLGKSALSREGSMKAAKGAALSTFMKPPSRRMSGSASSHPGSEPVQNSETATKESSLAAMHRQLSTSKRSTAVGAPVPVTSPVTSLSVPGSIQPPSKQLSTASSIAEDAPTPLPNHSPSARAADASTYGPQSKVANHADTVSAVDHFETSESHKSATAQEKHAYLHSQFGPEDVF